MTQGRWWRYEEVRRELWSAEQQNGIICRYKMTRLWGDRSIEVSSYLCQFIGSLQRELSRFGPPFVEPSSPDVYCTMILFLLYPVICDMWFVPFHFHNGFLSSLMETYGDPFALYRICPALMELRLDSGTYVCRDDSSFLVPFSFTSYIIHRFKAGLLRRRSHLLTWKSQRDQKAQHQGLLEPCSHHHRNAHGISINKSVQNNYWYLITVFI